MSPNLFSSNSHTVLLLIMQKDVAVKIKPNPSVGENGVEIKPQKCFGAGDKGKGGKLCWFMLLYFSNYIRK